MKEDKKWIQQVRKQLEDYSEPLPADLWEAIERDLDQSSVQPKLIPLWKRWQAVAAVVAVLVVSSTAVWLWQAAEPGLSNQISTVADARISEPKSDKVLPEEVDPITPVISQSGQSSTSLLETLISSPESADSIPVEMERVVSDVAVCMEDTRNVPEEDSQETNGQTDTSEKMRKVQRQADRERVRRNALLAVADKADASRNWQIGITSGNTFYSASNTFQGFSTLRTFSGSMLADNLAMNPVDDNEMIYTQVLFHNRDRNSETRIHHRMPVTVGVTLAYELSDKWSLESGLTYTLLSSELHTGGDSYIEEEQKLHYVGIPLKVKHTFWKNDWLTVYAVAGGAVEKCVSSSLETLYVTGSSDRKEERVSLDVNALQWSVSAAVGGQFNLTRQLGLYVEPGLAYYFDDGTGIETFRKEHPCNFNLQLGLRFTLPK